MIRDAIRAFSGILLVVAAATDVARAQEKPLPQMKWVADQAHSSIEFRVSHWGIVDVIGWFAGFGAAVYSDQEDFTDAVVEAWVVPASVQMPNSAMAVNLRGMFNVQEFPEARFKSTHVKPLGDNEYEVAGELTMKGVTRTVTLYGTLNGWGSGLPGFTLYMDLNRLDFGVGEEEELEAGQEPTIGHSVRVTFNIRLGFG